MTVRVTIDPELCIGSGDCIRVAPGAFQLDEARGVSRPSAGAAGEDAERLVRAAMGCPTQAIRLERDDAGVR